jgi:DNA-binding NarL/FixJ family response regulator
MKILLVDDHVVVRAGVRRLLAAEVDISILEAESSQEVLDL